MKIQTKDLRPGSYFRVRGKIVFSRVVTRIEGEELRLDGEKRRARGWPAIDKPYTSITLADPVIVPLDPNNITLEEKYGEQTIYTSQSKHAKGYAWTGINKGKFLPWIAELRGDTAVELDPEGELATGLDVTVIMRIFAVNGMVNHGVGIDGILINEPVRYFTGGIGDSLSQMGLTFQRLPSGQRRENTSFAEHQGRNANQEVNPMNGYANAMSAPVNPYQSSPIPEQEYQQAAPPPFMPEPQQMPQNANPYQQAPQPNPYGQPNTAPAGITYNPANDPNRNY